MKYTDEQIKAIFDEIIALKAQLKAEALAIAKEKHRRMSHLEIKLDDLEYKYAWMDEQNAKLRLNDD